MQEVTDNDNYAAAHNRRNRVGDPSGRRDAIGFSRDTAAAPAPAAEAKARAEQFAPIIRELQGDGYSMRGIAAELEKRKVQTPRGGAWHPQLVKRIVQRLHNK
jgi:Recombinase